MSASSFPRPQFSTVSEQERISVAYTQNILYLSHANQVFSTNVKWFTKVGTFVMN